MAQDTREGLGVHSGGQSVGGKCMPQIVESDARQSGLFQQFFQVDVSGIGSHGALGTQWVRKDPLRV